MDTHDALIAAILANPKDDLPRLVYADWLEERGDEWRANYIRKMIADKVGRVEYGGWDSGNPFGYDFGFREHPDRRLVLVAHRGFICEVRGLLEDVMTALPELVRKECVERVVVTNREPRQQHDGGWVWIKQALGMEQHILPRSVFNIGYVSNRWWSGPTTSVVFASREDAAGAASDALITWAKSQLIQASISATPVSVDITSS